MTGLLGIGIMCPCGRGGGGGMSTRDKKIHEYNVTHVKTGYKIWLP